MTDGGPLLHVEAVRASFAVRRTLREVGRQRRAQRLVALDGVSVSLGRQETLGIVGESGSGKSTLAKVLVRLVDVESGSVAFDGANVLSLRGRELKDVRRRMQMIYQDPYSSLNPRLSIGRAISEPARVHGFVERDGAEELAHQLLDQVGLARSVAKRLPRALSGGQRQRVAIARALSAKPDILIADEAVSALDVSVQAQILNLFSELQQQLGLGMLFISHQLSVVSHIADRVAVMYLGRIVEEGRVSEVFANPAHPYTVGLLGAQPGRHRRDRLRAPALQGEIPSALAMPSGCRFRTRCPLAQQICEESDPPAVELSDTHRSRCHIMPYESPPAAAEATP